MRDERLERRRLEVKLEAYLKEVREEEE